MGSCMAEVTSEGGNDYVWKNHVQGRFGPKKKKK